MKQRSLVFISVCLVLIPLLLFTNTTVTTADTSLASGKNLSRPAVPPRATAKRSNATIWNIPLSSNREAFTSAAAIPPVCIPTPRIMPLGNSITYGTYGSGYNGGQGDTRPSSQVTGYRQPLYLSLQAAGRSVNFVGSQIAGQQAKPTFDPDHQGHPGQTAGFIADRVFNWLNNNPADIVLLHVGTNNINSPNFSISATVDDVARTLDEIKRHEKYTIVVLALIVNRSCAEGSDNCQTKAQLTTNFNKALNSMAQARIAAGDRILIVDMEKGAGIDYKLTPQGDMADDLHPYKTGYEKMAAVWLNALKPVLPANCAYLPSIRSK